MTEQKREYPYAGYKRFANVRVVAGLLASWITTSLAAGILFGLANAIAEHSISALLFMGLAGILVGSSLVAPIVLPGGTLTFLVLEAFQCRKRKHYIVAGILWSMIIFILFNGHRIWELGVPILGSGIIASVVFWRVVYGRK